MKGYLLQTDVDAMAKMNYGKATALDDMNVEMTGKDGKAVVQ